MGRSTTSSHPSSPYITPQGYAQLASEVDQLWAKRNEVRLHLAAAAAEGDRSENAEYIYRKKELREIDRRIRYLQKRLPTLKIVQHTHPPAQVYFGARVTLEMASGEKIEYHIVGPDELAGTGRISVDSPMARALLGKSPKESVHVKTPLGETTYQIDHVRYD